MINFLIFGLFLDAKMAQKSKTVQDLLESLRTQINSRRNKNTDILSLSQQVCNN